MAYSFVHPAVESRGLDEMETSRERRRMLMSTLDPALGERVVEMSRLWPDLPYGALVGLAMAGADPYSDGMRGIDEIAAVRNQGQGFHSPGETVSAQQIARETPDDEDSDEGFLFRNAKAGVRGAFMGMQSAFDEVSRRATSGLVALQDPTRTYAQAMELSTPSQAALLASDEFGWADLGEGWIPGGEVRAEQEELKQRLTLGGEWMSPGRALAINVTEPGTKAFGLTSGLIDAAFNIVGDPATYATAGAGKLRAASKTFATDSALIRGIRGTTDEQFARQWWLGSAPGQRLRESLVDLDDPYEVWLRLGGVKGKVDRETSRLIANARTPGELDAVVLPRLGPQGIAEKPIGSAVSRGAARMFGDDIGAIHGLGIHLRRRPDAIRMLSPRWAQWMPDSSINTSDPDRAFVTLDRFLRGINADRAERGAIMNRAIRLGDDIDPNAAQLDNWLELSTDLVELASSKAVRDSVGVATDMRGRLMQQKIEGSIGRVWQRKQDELVSYFTRESGRPRSDLPTMIGGADVDFERVPHLVTEYLSSNIPLPDMQDIRRHIGGYAKAMRFVGDIPGGHHARGAFEGTVDLMSGFMTTLWKPMVLLRGAYIARVVGEEQLRMGAAGLDSAFRHPFSFMAYLTGRKGGVGLTGDPIRDMKEFQAIAQRKGGGWIGRKPGSVGTDDWVKHRRFGSDGRPVDDQAFARAYADDMGKLINDEVSTAVARMGADEAKDWWWSGAGQRFRREVASAEHNRAVWNNRTAADNYIDSVWLRIEEKTRGNTDLINAIATGRLDGKVVRWGQGTPSDDLYRGLLARLDEVGIEEVSGVRQVTSGARGSSDTVLLERYNQAVDFGADMMMSKPTNHMSRFPTWQQAYVKNIEAQLGFMDAPTQQAVIRWARKEANLSASEVRRLERTARAGAGTSILDPTDADLIARAAATRDTQRLLYEFTEHGQFSDMVRAAMPFAEAWKEIMLTWSRIVRDRPSVVRRGQQAVEGARGSGFFHTDPTSGEEMFTYPGGHFVSRGLMSGAFDSRPGRFVAGLPGVGPLAAGVRGMFEDEHPAEFDLVGTVAGANLFAGSIIPGLGPAVTIPASRIIPNRPEWTWVRDNLVFPFGAPDVESGLLETTLPAWLQKFRTAFMSNPDTDRVYANSVFDVAKMLMATGEYSTETPEEVNRLYETAVERAKGLWLIRGASQFVLPTGPSARFRVKDLEGDWWPFQVITQEYGRIRQEHGEEQATAEVLTTFGTDLISLVQSKSREVTFRPVSKVGDSWIRANDDLAQRYPLTVGVLAPDDPTGEFSYSAYQRHFDEGTRESLTPKQMLWLSNNTLGRFAYSHGVGLIGEGQDLKSRQERAALRAHLMERFPGFNAHIGLTERPRVDDQIRELEDLVADERVQGLEVTGAVREYLDERRKADALVAVFSTRSTTFTSSQETAHIRAMLRRKAEEIMARTPEFRTVWDRVLSRELADDELTAPDQMLPGMGG